ncbi:MAG: 50S ribosomal protein L29, partial [Micavibrio aeruginosavorus]
EIFVTERAGGGLEKTDAIRKVRRTIARVKTFLNQQETAAPKAAPKTKAKKA